MNAPIVTYNTSDRLATKLMISALRPMMFRHSFSALTSISREMVLVSLRVMSFPASLLLFSLTTLMITGMMTSHITMVARIQRISVAMQVNHTLLNGEGRVLGKIPKNLL